MNQFFPVIAAAVLIVGLTVPQALMTDRLIPRETTAEQKAMAERIESVAKKYMNFGEWEGKLQKIDDTSRKVARIVGDFSVQYQNKNHPDQVVSIMLACGHGKDMADHTPDQCFIASGFALVDHEQLYPMDLPGGNAQFTTCRFRKDVPGQGPQNIRIFWSFNENGKWYSPTFRMELRSIPALYKIYATTYLPKDSKEAPSQSIADPFLKELLPLIQAELFPSATDKASSEKGSPEAKESADASASPAPVPAEATPAK